MACEYGVHDITKPNLSLSTPNIFHQAYRCLATEDDIHLTPGFHQLDSCRHNVM